MTEASKQHYPIGDEVAIATLLDPPARRWPDAGITFLVANSARKNPGSLLPDWEPKDITGSNESINYVPMGNSAQGGFKFPGHYLATGNLNGCTAAAAAYRDSEGAVRLFLGHYDPESARETDDNGKLKISGLLARFAGQQPVKAAVAYSRAHDFPIAEAKEECQKLPKGSSVLLIPYETSMDLKSPTVGHMLYVARAGSDLIDFGWNGHELEIGEPEQFGEARRKAARALASAMAAEEEDWDMQNGE